MRTSILVCILAALSWMAALLAKPLAAEEFPLKDGDVWVMAGDSITAQHLHSNYFEAFCYARYPKLKFSFRNSGVGGHTIPSTLARFEYDIAAWKPTVVSVELGMNDSGGTATDKFVSNMGGMVERIRGIKARPVILAASPVNDGTTIAKLTGRNVRLDEYAKALKGFAAKEEIPYADQFHALVDIWGKNKLREALADDIDSVRRLTAKEKSLEGIEYLQAFLAVQDKNPNKPVSMKGDAVHPGSPGQLLMAAALLKALGADPFVSSATLDVRGKPVEAKGCKIENVAVDDNGRGLQFERLDERLWFPIPEEARAATAIDPTPFELSQYTLKVTGLKSGNYVVRINTAPVATVSDAALARGVNLSEFGMQPSRALSPLIEQSRAILNAVAAKENVVNQWRGLSQKAHAPAASADLKEQLAALTKQVEEADAKIRAAAEPKKLRFQIAAVSQ